MLNLKGTRSLTDIAKDLGLTTAAVSKMGDYFHLESGASGRGKNSEYSEDVFEIFKAIVFLRSLDFSFEEIKELRKTEERIFELARYFLYEGKKEKSEPKPPKGLEAFDRVAVIKVFLIPDYCPISTRAIEIDNLEFQKALVSGNKEAVELNELLEKRKPQLKRMLDNSKDALDKIKEKERRAQETIKLIKATIDNSTY